MINAYKSFAINVTGGSHIKHGKGCEDYSDDNHDDDDSGVSIAVVADGHGDDNCFRSAKGSELAVMSAKKGIQDFVKFHKSKFKTALIEKKTISKLTKEEFDKAIRDIVKRIIATWQVNVGKNYTSHPFTAEELAKADEKHRKMFEEGIKKGTYEGLNKAYGTTLIAAAITPYYWFGIHIGDGRLTALYPDGTFDQPVPWDEKCFLNVTTSICDDDSFEQARCYFSYHAEKAPPVAVFLCTDGVDDNYPVEENEKHLYKLYRTIALTFSEDGFESTKKQLKDLAINRFATKGKCDDTSIAGFIDMGALKQAVPIWKKQIAEEEAAAEKAKEPGTQAETETGSEDSKTNAAHNTMLAASAAYGKQLGYAKGSKLEDYGDYLTGKEKQT